MYRESLVGLALAATLEELESSLSLTEAQKESLWRVLDRTMERCLAEAPVMSRVTVTCPPPSVQDLLPAATGRGHTTHVGGSGHQSTPERATEASVDSPQTTSSERPAAVTASASASPSTAYSADCDVAFPVYRRVDDMWTILLKNPTVDVRDELGNEESFCLDYLKVYLKDASDSAAPKRKKARK